jgi:hypothetical protein
MFSESAVSLNNGCTPTLYVTRLPTEVERREIMQHTNMEYTNSDRVYVPLT